MTPLLLALAGATVSLLMVGVTGFEPATLCSQSRCATKLRYTPMDTYVRCPIIREVMLNVAHVDNNR